MKTAGRQTVAPLAAALSLQMPTRGRAADRDISARGGEGGCKEVQEIARREC